MWKFTEIADWWDQKKSATNDIMDRWVEDSDYNQGVMLVAATTHSITTFGAGFVDLLRIGDGVQEGGIKGWGTDGLRLIGIFPVGKVSQLLSRARGVRAAALLADINPNAGICAWVASAKALRQIGHRFNGKLFATVEDLAKAVGVEASMLGGLGMGQVANIFKQIGAKTGAVTNIQAIAQLKTIVPHDGSVVMIKVASNAMSRGVIHQVWHLVYAYREIGGSIKFMDRSVNGVVQGVYSSLDEISNTYIRARVILDPWMPESYMILHNVFVKSVATDAPRLVLPVLGVMASEDNGNKK